MALVSPSFFMNLLAFYTALHCIISLVSVRMASKSPTQTGFNPDSKQTNVVITLMLFTILIILGYHVVTPRVAGILSLFLGLRTFYQLFFQHFSNFLSHTARVRRARIIYETTGEKIDRSTPGYASFNTLMLSGVVCIVGCVALFSAAYWGFTVDYNVQQVVSHIQTDEL